MAATLVLATALTAGGAKAQTPPAGTVAPTDTAERVDVVVLKDGSRLIGRVLQSEAGVFVKVETEDGRVTTVAWAQVVRVSTGVPRSELATTPPAGTSPPPPPAAAPPAPTPGTPPTGASAQNQDSTSEEFPPRVTAGDAGGGIGVQAGGTFAEAEERRRQWLNEGGWLVGGDAVAQLVVLRMSAIDLSGYGFGGGLHGTVYHLAPPETEGGTWMGLRFGGGIDAATVRVSVGDESLSASSIVVPFNVGAQVGIGSAEGKAWSGVMLGLDYRPSYQTTKVKGYESAGGFSWTGFQVTADFVDFGKASEDLASAANWRVSAFLLPETDELPFLLILGFGAVWY